MRQAQLRDQHTSLIGLVEVEPPEPRVDQVVRDLHPGGDGCLELPHGDVCGFGVRQGDHGEEPVWVDVMEVSPEGCHQPAAGCVGLDVVDCPQFLSLKDLRVPPLWWSGGLGGHGLPVLVRCGASRGGVPCGGVRMSLRYTLRAGLLLRGHRMGRGGGRGATRPLWPEASVISSSAPGSPASCPGCCGASSASRWFGCVTARVGSPVAH